MPQINFDLPRDYDSIVRKFSFQWNLTKPETIIRIIKEFGKLSEIEEKELSNKSPQEVIDQIIEILTKFENSKKNAN